MRHRSSIALLAGIATASLLLTHASPVAAGSAPPVSGASAAPSVAQALPRPGLNFILELESDLFDTQGSPRSVQRLSALEQAMISRSADGLFEVFHRDGSATIDLQGRFQEFSFVRIGADGRLIFSCMDEYADVREALFAASRASTAWEER
jgi:hypothetical protein